MLALVRAQVDVGERALEKHGMPAGSAARIAGQREDRAVVRRRRTGRRARAGRAPRGARRRCRSMTSGRRPSLTLGTHSMTAMCVQLIAAFRHRGTSAPSAPVSAIIRGTYHGRPPTVRPAPLRGAFGRRRRRADRASARHRPRSLFRRRVRRGHQPLDPRAVPRSHPRSRARLHRSRAQRASRAAAHLRSAGPRGARGVRQGRSGARPRAVERRARSGRLARCRARRARPHRSSRCRHARRLAGRAGDAPARARAAVAGRRCESRRGTIALWWVTAAAIVLVGGDLVRAGRAEWPRRWFPVQATTGTPAAIVAPPAPLPVPSPPKPTWRGARAVCGRQAARRAARARSRAGR